MNFMLNTGYTIYLKLTPAQLAARLKVSEKERPLLQNIKEENLPNFIETKLAERLQWYEKSHLIIDGFNPDLKLYVNEIKKASQIL